MPSGASDGIQQLCAPQSQCQQQIPTHTHTQNQCQLQVSPHPCPAADHPSDAQQPCSLASHQCLMAEPGADDMPCGASDEPSADDMPSGASDGIQQLCAPQSQCQPQSPTHTQQPCSPVSHQFLMAEPSAADIPSRILQQPYGSSTVTRSHAPCQRRHSSRNGVAASEVIFFSSLSGWKCVEKKRGC